MPKFVADKVLTPSDFEALARSRGRPPVRARKATWVAARRATPGERIETRWNGVETANEASQGDWVVTNLDPHKQPLRDDDGAANMYVVGAEQFKALYARAQGGGEYGDFYRPRAHVLALYLHGGFDILAPWGERQRADRGYLILNGDDVYGNHVDTFKRTYKTLSRAAH